MSIPDSDLTVVDSRGDEQTYFHPDFHHLMYFLIRYFDEHLGPQQTERFLSRVGTTVYAPLIDSLCAEGLPALERHWRSSFTAESGNFSLDYEGETLILTVHRCPAVAFLQQHNDPPDHRFCLSTTIVIRSICAAAGYTCSCVPDTAAARCVQRFWKESP